MKEFISLLAPLIIMAATVPYIIDILRGKSRPNVVSWFTWVILLAIATSAAFIAHESRTAFLTLGDLIGTSTVLILGIKFGIAKMNKTDILCQVGAVAGIILWAVFDSPTIAILSTIIIDFIVVVPTLRHAWESPQEETWQTYAITAGACILTLFSLTTYNIASLAYPVYLPLANGILVFIIVYRREKLGLNLIKPGINESIHIEP